MSGNTYDLSFRSVFSTIDLKYIELKYLIMIKTNISKIGTNSSQQEQKMFRFHNIQFLRSNADKWLIYFVM